jgi:predicted DNA-binding transcriptional regulator AlpA
MENFDVQLYSLAEQLDRIEEKIDNRLNKTWLSITDVIKTTGLSRSTINRAIALGDLKSVKNKGKRMMRKSWIDRWITG